MLAHEDVVPATEFSDVLNASPAAEGGRKHFGGDKYSDLA